MVGPVTGGQLRGATVLVPGDTARFHLVTDSYGASFGYRVVAIKASFPNALLGDIDKDGFVTGRDRLLLNRRLNNLDVSPFTDLDFDLDGDGAVTSHDRDLLNQILDHLAEP